MKNAKIYRGLNNTVPIVGVPFAYLGFLTFVSVAVYMLSNLGVFYAITTFVVGHFTGVLFTSYDNRWWEVVCTNIKFFKTSWLRRTRYVV